MDPETNFNQRISCPGCSNKFVYFKRVLVRRVKKLEDCVENAFATRSREEDGFDRSECLECPYCDIVLQLHLEIKVVGIEIVSRERREYNPAEKIKRDFVGLINECRTAGLIAAFEQAVHAHLTTADSRPRDIEMFFVNFLSAAQPVPKNKYAVEKFVVGFQGDTELWHAHSLGMIVVGGQIRRFLPFKVLRKSIHSQVKLNGRVVGALTNLAQEWVRTRNGYVPLTSKVFLEELRNKSKGQFARLGL